MKVGIFSDTHLGNTMYKNNNIPEGDRDYGRKDDYRDTFEEAVETFLREKPDYVFHAGDLLEARAEGEIYNESIKVAIEGLSKLLKAGINVVLIEGNHDFVRSHSVENRAFSIIETALNDFVGERLFIVRANSYGIIQTPLVPIVAFGYFYEDNPSILKSKLEESSKRIGNKPAFLILHQSVGEYIPYYSIKYSDIPQNFRVIINGHIHKPLIKVLPDRRLFINVGSTEYENISESVDYREILLYDGDEFLRFVLKGVYILENGYLFVEKSGITDEGIIPKEYIKNESFIPLRKCRPFMRFDCDDWKTLEMALEKIKDYGLKPPYLRVELGSENRREVEEKLTRLLDKGYIYRYFIKTKSALIDDRGNIQIQRGGMEFEDMEPLKPYANLIRSLRGLDEEGLKERLREYFKLGR